MSDSLDDEFWGQSHYHASIHTYKKRIEILKKEIQELKIELKREKEESNKLIKALSAIVNYSFLESESSYSEAINALKAYKNG